MSDRNVLIQLAPDAGLMTTSHFQTTASASNDIYAVVSRYGAVFEPPRAHFAFDAVVGGPLSEVDEQLSRYGGAAALAADNAEAMAAELIRLPQITAAYVQPVPDVPVAPIDDRDLRLAPVVSMADAPLAAFPDFRTGQAYLGPPPGGIGAAAAWAALPV